MTKITLPKPKNRLNVGIDLDDTLGPLLDLWAKRMGRACEIPLELSETAFKVWGFPPVLEGKKVRAGLALRGGRVTTGKEIFYAGDYGSEDQVTRYDFLDPTIYDDFQPYEGGAEAVAKISAHPWVNALCITAHSNLISEDPNDPERLAYEAIKGKIIDTHFPSLKGNLHFSRHKDRFDLYILIDDGAHNIQALQKKGAHGILLHRPWNEEIKVENAVRVNSLSEAVPHIERLIENRIKKHWHPLFKRSTELPSTPTPSVGAEQAR